MEVVVLMILLLYGTETHRAQVAKPLGLHWLIVCTVGSIMTLTILSVLGG